MVENLPHLSVSILFLSLFCLVDSAYIDYNTTQRIVPDKINVHLVPHSHDDVGWLKTVDQYYVGSNNSIQNACVQNILDSVVQALVADRNRKFVYVEQAFFQRWWGEQSDLIKKITRELVSSGQLEFINGGMCMHDEASSHYIDMIDQTTLGHRFLKDEFNQTPRIGWQIDPFGHSAVQAYLLSAEVGFDALYFARIDYQDRKKRKDTKSLEIIWRGSKTLGSSADIFTGIFPIHYEPPSGFYFEVNDESSLVQDDFDLFDYNVQERVNDFVDAAIVQANVTRTNHIMFTMGTDFKYQYANTWFRQLDKLIHYVNKDGRVNVLYSSPSIYTDAKHAAKETWPFKTEDFFPYADSANGYWTGFFTSRPALKGFIRTLSSYYLAARQLEFFNGKNSSGYTTDTLADALAINQHHDAVTGTEKQHVADDYAKRLSIGYAESEKVVEHGLSYLSELHLSNVSTRKFEQCSLLNITYCPPSEAGISEEKSLVVLVYNSLGWKREDIIKIPVANEHVVVKNSEGIEIVAQLLPIANASIHLRNTHVKIYLGRSIGNTPNFWLSFEVSVPPLGFTTYFVSYAEQKGSKTAMSTVDKSHTEKNSIKVGQGNLKLYYDRNGQLHHYSNKRNMLKESLHQSFGYYSSDDGSGFDLQASGAYIFRPKGVIHIETSGQSQLKVLRGPIVDEIHQQMNPWIYQITRVYKGKEHGEIEYIVGPIPVDDTIGKEVVTQITTPMLTNKSFFTDSNGRDFIKRVRDYRSDWKLDVNQPISGNYYPINLGIYIKDDTSELSMMVDRSVGGSSIHDGQIELMLHRRLLQDDSKGVGEPLNEVVCDADKCFGLMVQGKFYFRVDPLGDGAKWRRTMGQEIYSPLLLAFTEKVEDNWNSVHLNEFSGMDKSYSLPDNIAIITLQDLGDGNVLLRLAHLYEVGEDKDLSTITNVDLNKVFPNKKIIEIKEMSLSANQERAEMEKKKLIWNVEGPVSADTLKGGAVDPSKALVELAPMEIRTFIIKFLKLSSVTNLAKKANCK